MKIKYLRAIAAVERIHRIFFEVIGSELASADITDINSVQALLIYHIGNKSLTVGELTARGYYLGTNVSYNLRKITKLGYADQTESKHDKRSSIITLSSKGMQVHKTVDKAISKHANLAKREELLAIDDICNSLSQLEMFFGKLMLNNPHLHVEE